MTDYESWDYLLRTWQEADIPEGWRAEIHGERIVMFPPQPAWHGLVASDVHLKLQEAAPRGSIAIQRIGVRIPALSRLHVPDVFLVAEADVPMDDFSIPAAVLLLVVEITSRGSADDDRGPKRRAYASGEVPLYLLVDAWDPAGPTVTLLSEPDNGDYASARKEPFGTPVHIPKPFGVDLETFEFPVPPEVAKRR